MNLFKSLTDKTVIKKIGTVGWSATKLYCFFHVAKTYILPLNLVVAQGVSMEPLIRNNDILITEKVSVRRQHLKTNDVVIATSPWDSKLNLCKKITRIGGEIGNDYSTDPEVKVPYGYVYLTGENRSVSRDSRDYGSIPYGLIQSRVLLRIWPLNEIKLFRKN